MKANKVWWPALLVILTTSACTNIPTRIHDSGVRIEPLSSDTGDIRSAAFWRDSEGLSLRGEVAANLVDKNFLAGHIDISITVPEQSNAVCTTVEWDADSEQVHKPFSQRFETLPPRGTRLRVWHHQAEAHNDCVS